MLKVFVKLNFPRREKRVNKNIRWNFVFRISSFLIWFEFHFCTLDTIQSSPTLPYSVQRKRVANWTRILAQFSACSLLWKIFSAFSQFSSSGKFRHQMKSWKVFSVGFLFGKKRTRKLIKFFFLYCCSFCLSFVVTCCASYPFQKHPTRLVKIILKKNKEKLEIFLENKKKLIKNSSFHIVVHFVFFSTLCFQMKCVWKSKPWLSWKQFPVQKILSEAQRWWRSNEEIILFFEVKFLLFFFRFVKRAEKLHPLLRNAP